MTSRSGSHVLHSSWRLKVMVKYLSIDIQYEYLSQSTENFRIREMQANINHLPIINALYSFQTRREDSGILLCCWLSLYSIPLFLVCCHEQGQLWPYSIIMQIKRWVIKKITDPRSEFIPLSSYPLWRSRDKLNLIQNCIQCKVLTARRLQVQCSLPPDLVIVNLLMKINSYWKRDPISQIFYLPVCWCLR
jgi:hypothetical protein